MENIQLGAIGISARFTIKDEETKAVINLSSATVMKIIFKSPAGVRTEKVASFVTNGTDGKIEYITQSGDLNETGVWKIQAYVEYGGIKAFSTIVNFKVIGNL